MKIRTDDFDTIRKQVMLGGVRKVGVYFSLFKWRWIYYAVIDEPETGIYEDTDLDKEEAWATAVSFVVWCALIVLVVVYLIFVLVR